MRGEVAALEDAAGEDAEPQLDLVEPGGVFRRVEELDAVGRGRRGRRRGSAWDAQDARPGPSRPGRRRGRSGSATRRTSASDWWVLRLSARKSQGASGSVATTWAMWAAKSASVRVGPSAGARTCPVATLQVAIRLRVPWRMYSCSRRSGRRGAAAGRGGALERLDAGQLVGAGDVAAQRLQHRGVGVGGADASPPARRRRPDRRPWPWR